MKRHLTRLALVVLTTFLLTAIARAAEPVGPKLPQGYREWTHVKSMVIHSDKHPLFHTFSGIHHVYVNRAGLSAAKAHGKFPDGSVLVFDLLQSNEAEGAYVEGARKVVAVMQKDASRYKSTGGWGFQAFKGGQAAEATVTDPTGQCFSCHQSQKDSDFVFSTFRD